MLRAGRSEVRIPVWARDFSHLQNVQTGSAVHPASCTMGTEILKAGGARN
jgi:hypothetical protein